MAAAGTRFAYIKATEGVRLRDPIANELHLELECVHEPGGYQTVLPLVATYRHRAAQKDQRRNDPEHEDMLGHGKVDAEHGRKLNERVIDRAIGDVLDDDCTGVELFGRL